MDVLLPSAERNCNMKYNMKPTLLDTLDSVNMSVEILKCAAHNHSTEHNHDTRIRPLYYSLTHAAHSHDTKTRPL
jgi:hypothetical protein